MRTPVLPKWQQSLTASLPYSCHPLSLVTSADKTEKASLYFLPLQQQNMEDIWNLTGFPNQNCFHSK